MKRDLVALEYAKIELGHRTLEMKYKASKLKRSADASRVRDLEVRVAELEAMAFHQRKPEVEQNSAAASNTKVASMPPISRSRKGQMVVAGKANVGTE